MHRQSLSTVANAVRSRHVPDHLRGSCSEKDEGNPERRVRIIHHATRAFLMLGFEGANLTDIAAASGVGKVTIYRYFADKTDLLRHVMLEAAEHVSMSLRDVLDPTSPLETVLLRFAERFVSNTLDVAVGLRPLHELARLMYATSLTHPEITAACRTIYRNNTFFPLSDYFRAMVAKGALIDEDPAFLAGHFMQMLSFSDFAMMEPSFVPARQDVEMIARRTVALFVRGSCLR